MNRTIFTAMIILHTFVLAAQNLYEQNRSAGSRQNLSESATVVKGIIRTSDGKPAANVNVILKDTRFASVTNELGEYYFYNVPEGGYTVVVSFTGLKTVQKEFDLKKGDVKVFDFTLYENQYQFAEIIIKAYNNNNTKAAAIGKINIRPMDLPQSIATVSETVIRDQQAQRLSDVVKNVNGVYLSSARASTQESFYARGYSFSSTNMFKSGSRVNSGVMPEVSSLESVEILKGSAAILYGNVSPGGILNMITKKPKFAFGGEVSMRAGSFNLWKPSIDLYGPLTKKIAYRLNATYESANSYRDQVSSTRYYINPSFLFKLGNKTELIVEGDYFKHDFTPDFGIGSLDNTNIPDVPRSRFMGTSWQYNISRQTTSSATIKHVFNNNWQLNSILSYQVFSRDYYAVERIQAKANGDWARPLGIIHTKEKYNTGQVNVTGKFNTGKLEHAILAGIDADHYLTQAYNYDVQGKIYDSINILEPSKYVQSIDIPAGGFTTIDITAGYSRKRFSLLAKVANLGNV